MTTIEKVTTGVTIVSIILFIVSVNSCVNEIEDAGGISGIIIEAGKEVNRISNEISKDEAL